MYQPVQGMSVNSGALRKQFPSAMRYSTQKSLPSFEDRLVHSQVDDQCAAVKEAFASGAFAGVTSFG